MFQSLSLLPADPILGLITKFQEDTNPNKIDLGVGVYKNEQGLTPVLQAVQQAEENLLRGQLTKSYIGPAGPPRFNELMKSLVFGEEHRVLQEERVAMVQTPGGCGALRVAAELILRSNPSACIWVSDPTWGNHIPLLGDSGLEIKTYPYYDFDNHCVRFEDMLNCLEQVPAGDLVLLHGCCHNPSGADLTQEQWRRVAELAQKQGFTPFVDMAYQGFGESLDNDAFGIRLLAEMLPELVIAVSCSKNFGLYRERAGAVAVVSETGAQARSALSHINTIVRGIYSMPPAHGALIVAEILGSDSLRDLWQAELVAMKDRLEQMRKLVVGRLNHFGAANSFDFLASEKGMFSFMGLSEPVVDALAEGFGIYMLANSRISLSGFNTKNVNYFSEALCDVLKSPVGTLV